MPSPISTTGSMQTPTVFKAFGLGPAGLKNLAGIDPTSFQKLAGLDSSVMKIAGLQADTLKKLGTINPNVLAGARACETCRTASTPRRSLGSPKLARPQRNSRNR